MIDSHIHVRPPGLPGAGNLSPLLEAPTDQVASALRHEMAESHIDHVLAMGCIGGGPTDPLGVSGAFEIAANVPGLHPVGVADPNRTDGDSLHRADQVLAAGRIKALKIDLGYLHHAPDHPGYQPYYKLAEKHKIPVIFHTGDTYSARAKLRFAHPLLIDDVAVDHPAVKFVVAHMGNPWLIEAAEVIYKNVNVWTDLSGLLVGDQESFQDTTRHEMMSEVAQALAKAFRYAERPNRFLFGSDWPLAPLAAYRDFIRSAIPEMHHHLVFKDNAQALFHL